MSVLALIRECRDAGIHLQPRGDRLRVEAPAGTVTPELRQRLAENKVELLVALTILPDSVVNVNTRTALLALAGQLGVDRAVVDCIPAADLSLWTTALGEALRVYLLALGDAAARQAGKVPVGDTAAIHCTHCGPVYVHPGIAAVLPVVAGWPRALGCPWCHVRKAGGIIPRPA